MDILSDVKIVGTLNINSPVNKNGIVINTAACNINAITTNGEIYASGITIYGNGLVDDLYGSCSTYTEIIAVNRLRLPSMTRTISVPAQCTKFLIDSFDIGGGSDYEKIYPVVTAYREDKKVDMDIELLYVENTCCSSGYWDENVIGNITSCSSEMTLKVSMIG